MKQHMRGWGAAVTAVIMAVTALTTDARTAAAEPPEMTAAPAVVGRIDRLVGLARIWAEVKYFHPALFQRAVDWDGALIKAIPEVEAASDAATYRAAIGHLLAAVGDPRTMIEPDVHEGPAPATWKTWAGDGVLVLDARLPTREDDYAATRRLAREVRPELATARVVVIDLRDRAETDHRLLESILDSLPVIQTWPVQRSIQHLGFRSQGDTNRDTYTTSWLVDSAGATTRGGASAGPRHVVFAVDPRHALPVQAVALWASGRATLVASHALDDSSAAITKRIPLPYSVVGLVRIADVIVPGDIGLTADVVVRPGEDVRARAIAVAAAIASGQAPVRAPRRHVTTSSDLRLVDDDDAPQTGLPTREQRMLAAIKAWATIEYFHAPRRLDHDWDRQLRATLPRVEGAADPGDYRDALAEMLVPLRDGHSYVRPRSEVGNRASTAIYWRRIDGKIVAGALRDEAVARAAGIALGDELVSVGGIPAEYVASDRLRTVASGTEESRRQWAVATVDRGGLATTVDLEVRSPGGAAHRMTLRRDYDYDHNFWARSGPHYRMLSGNIGYVDLARLTSDEVDATFDALGKTRAIVFDMRGYPNGTAWLVGERIDTHSGPVLAEIRTPWVSPRTAGDDITMREPQRGRISDKPPYRGKVVVLIDDRAVSAAEHLCLVFEATSNATFIGSPTSGTNGEETYVRLPGGLEMRFTGMEILHADGRQLQQVGIQPQITVRPTLRGLRAGKDEVLDRALRFLQTGR
jgi:C-terminal processing protease CtpA/Prc